MRHPTIAAILTGCCATTVALAGCAGPRPAAAPRPTASAIQTTTPPTPTFTPTPTPSPSSKPTFPVLTKAAAERIFDGPAAPDSTGGFVGAESTYEAHPRENVYITSGAYGGAGRLGLADSKRVDFQYYGGGKQTLDDQLGPQSVVWWTKQKWGPMTVVAWGDDGVSYFLNVQNMDPDKVRDRLVAEAVAMRAAMN